MRWEHLAEWGRAARVVDRLDQGMRNDVRTVEIDGHRRVGRLGSRSAEDLDWETALLVHLRAHGLGVPAVVPTRDGRLHVGGLVVMEYVHGRALHDSEDWAAVASALRRLHSLTAEWPQRPGWKSSIDLLTADRGTSIALEAMPPDAVKACRAAWQRLADQPQAVVHGDPNGGNIRMTDSGPVLLDWDEARRDVPLLDLAALPTAVAGMSDDEAWAAAQAASAWEAAVSWQAEPEYAMRRLAEVRQV